jgi:ribosomal protein S8
MHMTGYYIQDFEVNEDNNHRPVYAVDLKYQGTSITRLRLENSAKHCNNWYVWIVV